MPDYRIDFTITRRREGEDPADLWDEDGYQSYKDGVATGLLNEDGTQREPREPDFEAEDYARHCDEAHDSGECDCPPPSPGDWTDTPGDPGYAEEAPF